MARWIVVAALFAALIGGGAALIIRAQSDDSATELRLSARRLDDGTVELGLQRRTPDGWSARILPDGRFLSLEIPNNEWLNSAAFALSEPDRGAAEAVATPAADDSQAADEAGQSAPADAEAETAQQEQEQADSASVETAEEAVDDGRGDETGAATADAEEDPGGEQAAKSAPADDASGAFDAHADRIIEAVNDARALRASAPPPPSYEVYLVRTGDTLSGIAHTHGIRLARLLEFNGLTPEALIYPDDELLIPSQTDQVPPGGRVVTAAVDAASGADGALPYVPIEAPFEMIGDSTAYGTIRDQPSKAVHSAALTLSADGARLVVACAEGELVAFVRLSSEVPEPSADAPAAVRVHYFLDDGRLRSDRWRVGGERLFAAPDAEGFMAEIGGSERIDLRVEAGDAPVNLTFTIADLLTTPIQPNLDRCGAPAPTLSGPAD